MGHNAVMGAGLGGLPMAHETKELARKEDRVTVVGLGDTGIAFVALPQIPPRNVNWFSEGKWVRLAKVAFERYFIRKLKKGTSEPIYEKYVMQALGITKLEAK